VAVLEVKMVKLGDRVRLSAPRLKHGSQHRVCSTSALVSLSNTRRCDEDLLPGADARLARPWLALRRRGVVGR
jgi:hypothetical protein